MIYANFHDLPRICSKRPLRVLFHPQQRCGITRGKSKHRKWQSPVRTVCLFFVFFWVDPEVSKSRTCLAISLENSSMVQEIVKVFVWAQTGTCIYIYINIYLFICLFIYLSILNAQQGMVFVGSRHFTTCLWFMPIFTICHVYAVKRRLRVLFHPQQRCGITREKSKHRTWQSPVCTVCLFFVVFWVDPEVSKSRTCLAISFENSSMVQEMIWAQTGTCIYIYTYFLNAQQGMVFVGSRHFTTCFWFMPIFTICHVYAVKRPLRVLFHPQQRCGFTREKSKHRTWQSPVCTVCSFFVVFWVDPEVSKSRTCLAISFENSSMVQEIVKVLIWAQTGTCIYIYILIYIYSFIYCKCTAGNGFCWFEAFYNMFMIYANFHDLPRICSKKAVTSTFSPPTEMWNYKREK